jgi:DNA replication protein DnaC
VVERLGDVLKRLAIDAEIVAAGTEPPPEEPGPACPRCRDAGYMRADVPVGHPDFGKLYLCECRRQQVLEERKRRLERYSNLGPLARLTFNTLLPDGLGVDPRRLFARALAAAHQFAEQPKGWLVLIGPPGCGKTHLAAAIANARLAAGEPVFFAFVPDLLDHLRSTFHPESEVRYDELFETVRQAPLLVLDDLGTHSSTAWAQGPGKADAVDQSSLQSSAADGHYHQPAVGADG